MDTLKSSSGPISVDLPLRYLIWLFLLYCVTVCLYYYTSLPLWRHCSWRCHINTVACTHIVSTSMTIHTILLVDANWKTHWRQMSGEKTGKFRTKGQIMREYMKTTVPCCFRGRITLRLNTQKRIKKDFLKDIQTVSAASSLIMPPSSEEEKKCEQSWHVNTKRGSAAVIYKRYIDQRAWAVIVSYRFKKKKSS